MTSLLFEACENCRKKTEQSLDNLLRINQELQAENDQLKTNPMISPDVETFLNLIAEDIEWQEAHITNRTSGKIITKIEAFRKIRPKEANKSANS
jgi:hypothetical protein